MVAPKTRIILVALNPAKHIPDLIAQGRGLVQAVTGNAHFPTPNPPLAQITTDLDALEAAQTVAQTRAKGAAAARNVQKRIVLDDLHTFAAHAQQRANADPSNAEAIITSSTLSVKKAKTVHLKPDFQVKGIVTGTVDLIVKSAGHRVFYDWQMSADQKTWTNLPSTMPARTTVTGLTPATVVYFRYRAQLKTGPTDWSQVVSHLVN